MTSADLSSKKALRFRAKGQGKTFAVMVYAQSSGLVPKVLVFDVGPEWKVYAFLFAAVGLEGHDLMGIVIGASMTPGVFALMIDDVRLR